MSPSHTVGSEQCTGSVNYTTGQVSYVSIPHGGLGTLQAYSIHKNYINVSIPHGGLGTLNEVASLAVNRSLHPTRWARN